MYWSVKGGIFSSHCDSHSVHILLLGEYVTDYVTVFDLGALEYFIPVDEKQLLVTLMSPTPWKIRTVFLDIPLLYFSLLGIFVKFRCSLVLPVSGQMTALNMSDCRVIFPVFWSITAQSSPYRPTRGSGLMSAAVGVFIVAT